MNKIGAVAGAMLVIGALATACGGTQAPTATQASSGSAAAMTAENPTGPTITISGMAFGEPLVVTPGATITIVNKDAVEHSVTSKPDAGFSTDVDGGEQKTFIAPTQPGDYPFICKYHSNMKGTLTVR
ncbi:MAG: plastocyanin [Mycobacterium sp.]|jgi:plastocyanin|nr:plastocyanin [Mycobacterium sp.]MDT5177836.1 hypothetical protein [Mycobacterium sp.]